MTSLFQQNNQTANLNLPAGPSGQKRSVPCLFGGLDGKRLTLELGERLPCSAVVSVEFNDALFLGEVVCHRAESQGRWVVEIQVEQILTGLQSLITLRSRLLGEAVGASAERTSLARCA